MYQLFEMRAYKNETDFDRVGFIILDEDEDEPMGSIYEDERITVSCGSNWSLQEADLGGAEADDIFDGLICRGYCAGEYHRGDWKDMV